MANKYVGDRALPYGLANFNRLYGQYRKRARAHNFEFSLTKEEFRNLNQKECFYCGKKPSQVFYNKGSNGDYVYNGIDRVDSKKGYVLDNCVPCCSKCNYGKLYQSKQEFLDWVLKVYNHSIKQNGT